MAGQTISDRILAARHSLAGQGLAKSVCKATTEEVLGPKKKHLEYLLHCTNEPNVSIPQLANLLIERSQTASWVVVFKSLITTHHLMCYGNERFTQYLASSNCSFQLSNYTDKSGGPQGYDMSPFIRRYSTYLNEKAFSYRGVAFDFCKVKRGKDDGTLRTMPTDKLLKTLPILQNQLDALLAFDATANDLTNSVINTAFMYLFRDLIRLFACYNDGIINLLEKYFDMNKKQCKDALDCYKKFLIRMDRVAEFLKVAETVGLDKSEIPDLKKAPGSLLDALEAHLASLEGKKPGKEGAPAPAPSQASSANGTVDQIDETIKKKVLAEEEAAMEKFKKNTNPFLSSPTSSAPSSSATAASAPAISSSAILDLFSMEDPAPAAPAAQPAVQAASTTKALDDLLGLGGNPFAATQQTTGLAQQAPPIPPMPVANTMGWNSMPGAMGGQPQFMGAQTAMMAPMMQPNGYGMQQSSLPSHFVSGNSFNSVFGTPNGKPANGFDAFGDVMQPQVSAGFTSAPKAPSQSKVITGDLDSSLASLAQNLNINKMGQSQNRPIGGGAPGVRPMQPMAPAGAMMGGAAQPGWPQQQPGMYGGPMQGMVPGASAPMMRPNMVPMMQPMVGSVAPTMGSTVPMTGLQQSTPFGMTGSQSQSLDPFGAL